MIGFQSSAFQNSGFQSGKAPSGPPSAESGVGGGTSSWERRRQLYSYAAEAQGRWQEAFTALLEKEREAERAVKAVQSDKTRARIAQLHRERKVLEGRLAELERSAAAEEEHLIMAFLH